MPATKIKNTSSPVNEKVSQMTGQFSYIAANKLAPESQSNTAAVEVLGRIYDLLKHANELKQVQAELDRNALQIKNLEEEQRNQEIIKALTGKVEKPKSKDKKIYQPKKTEPKKIEPKKTEPVKTETNKVEKPQKVETQPKQKSTPTAQPTGLPNSGATPAASAQPVATTPIIPSVIGAAAVTSLSVMATSVIAKEEGLPRGGKAYWDPPGHKDKLVSIGYGHQIKPNEYKQGYIDINGEKVPLVGDRGIDTKLTTQQSKNLLAIDLPKYEDAAKNPLGTSWNKLTDKQKTALISYSYNVGSTNNLVKAGLKDAIESNDMSLASKIIYEKGIKTSGGKHNEHLDERRARESKMFADGAKTEQVNNKLPSTIVESTNSVGQQLNNSSQENKDMKKQLQQTDSNAQVNINNTTTSSGGSSSSTKQKGDDRPAMVRKSQEK